MDCTIFGAEDTFRPSLWIALRMLRVEQ